MFHLAPSPSSAQYLAISLSEAQKYIKIEKKIWSVQEILGIK
jgi:hypothetical protein